MLWLVYCLGAALFQSGSTLLVKKQLVKNHSTEFLTIYMFFSGLLSLFLIPFVKFNIDTYTFFLLFMLAIIFVEAAIFSTKALKHMEISTAVPMTNLSPIFLLVLAYFFLGEKINGIQFLGILFLVFGAYILESDNTKKAITNPLSKLKKSKHLHCAVFGIILYSIAAITEKYMFNKNLTDPLSMVFYVAFFSSIITLTFQLILFDNFKGVKYTFKKSWFYILICAVMFLLSTGFYYFSIDLIYVSIALPVKRISTLISTILGGRFFHEKYILYKSIACIVMLLGLYLIAIPSI